MVDHAMSNWDRISAEIGEWYKLIIDYSPYLVYK